MVTAKIVRNGMKHGIVSVCDGLESYGVDGIGCIICGNAFCFMDENEYLKEKDYPKRIAEIINEMEEEEDEDGERGEGYLYELCLRDI